MPMSEGMKVRIRKLVEELEFAVEPIYMRYREMQTEIGTPEDADKLFVMARYHLINSENGMALEYFELADNAYRLLEDSLARVYVNVFAAIGLRNLREKEAEDKIALACSLAEREGDDFALMYALKTAIVIYHMFGSAEEGDAAIRRAEDIVKKDPNPYYEGLLAFSLGYVSELRRDYENKLKFSRRSYEAFAAFYGDVVTRNSIVAQLNLGESLADNGFLDEALVHFKACEENAKTFSFPMLLLIAMAKRADVYYRRKSFREAFEVHDEYVIHFESWMQQRLKDPEGENEELKYKLELSKDEIMMKNSELIEKKRMLEQLIAMQKWVQEVGSKLTGVSSIDEIFRIVCEASNTLFICDGILLGLIDGDNMVIRHAYSSSTQPPLLPLYIPLSSTEHMISYCIRHNQDMMIRSVDEYTSYVMQSDLVRRSREKRAAFNQSSMYLRLVHKDRVFGLLTVQKREAYAYTDEEFEALKGLASFVSIAINNAIQNKILEEKAEELEIITLRDELTWLENRRAYNLYVSELVANDRRYALIFADMNHLKDINDGLGHISGDLYLTTIAEVLRSVAKDHRKFRLSGDEFAVIVENPRIQNVFEIVTEIKQACAAAKVGDFPLTLAIGCAIRKSGDTHDKVFTVAEARMYLDKHDCHVLHEKIEMDKDAAYEKRVPAKTHR